MIIDLNNLAIVEHALGPEHIIVSQALNNPAENERARGRYDDALPLLARAARFEAMTDDDVPPDWAAIPGLPSPPPSAGGHRSEPETPLRLLESPPNRLR